MKKILSILGVIVFTSLPITTVISCSNTENQSELNTENQSELPLLQDVILKKDLGYFENYPTDNEILLKIKELNPELDITQVLIYYNNFDQKVIRVNYNSTVYNWNSEEIVLSFEYDHRQYLQEVIFFHDIGTFHKIPIDEEILKRLKEQTYVDTTQIKIINNNQVDEVTIKTIENSMVYKESSLTLNYNVDLRIDLEKVIENTELGEFFEAPSFEEILKRVKELNPELDISQVEVNSYYVN
jgi:hypothetical protein